MGAILRLRISFLVNAHRLGGFVVVHLSPEGLGYPAEGHHNAAVDQIRSYVHGNGGAVVCRTALPGVTWTTQPSPMRVAVLLSQQFSSDIPKVWAVYCIGR